MTSVEWTVFAVGLVVGVAVAAVVLNWVRRSGRQEERVYLTADQWKEIADQTQGEYWEMSRRYARWRVNPTPELFRFYLQAKEQLEAEEQRLARQIVARDRGAALEDHA